MSIGSRNSTVSRGSHNSIYERNNSSTMKTTVTNNQPLQNNVDSNRNGTVNRESQNQNLAKT